jgi:exopolysaccharide biosynthesis protein
LASVFIEYGARFAYNLDGGGSATMWFNGRLINKPTNSGSTISERSISDIIYIGYDL